MHTSSTSPGAPDRIRRGSSPPSSVAAPAPAAGAAGADPVHAGGLDQGDPADVQRRQCHRQLRRAARQAVEAVPRQVPARASQGGIQGLCRQHVDFKLIVAKTPIAKQEASVSDKGVLVALRPLRHDAEPRLLRARIHHVGRRVEADQDQRQRPQARRQLIGVVNPPPTSATDWRTTSRPGRTRATCRCAQTSAAGRCRDRTAARGGRRRG